MREFADGSKIEVHEGGGITFDGPTAVGMFRLVALKQALKWEIDHPDYGSLIPGGVSALKVAESDYRAFSEREGLEYDGCDPAKPHPFGVGIKGRTKALAFVNILLDYTE